MVRAIIGSAITGIEAVGEPNDGPDFGYKHTPPASMLLL